MLTKIEKYGVDTFPGHIACDSGSRSEIVIPLRNGEGEVIGVPDLDSHEPSRFDEDDRAGLSGVVEILCG